jgi:hypothetical protein
MPWNAAPASCTVLTQLGDPRQFLEFAYRSTQLATLPF